MMAGAARTLTRLLPHRSDYAELPGRGAATSWQVPPSAWLHCL